MTISIATPIRLEVQIAETRHALGIGPSGRKPRQQIQRHRVSMALAGLACIDPAAAALHTSQKQGLQ